ncbi:guanine deaminase [Maritalea porphyrae]|uniref:guanine deaminase n=1 Tax=Maritalea porphyrae TaxID=880732 RepID=UPI0022B06D03|nr:guanine deaminase [Maritalea porphyrae]MCZ4272106.1 guanine deaminase [Maritalea porphyrae]
MTLKILRGRVLSFNDAPKARDDQDCYTYLEDGALLIDGGKIMARGEFADIAKSAPADVQTIDHRPHIIMAGFIDTHIHFPQMQVLGSYAGSLLEWLNTYTFVEEQRFGDLAHAKKIAGHFYDEVIRHGTTTAVAYCSVHTQSVDAYFEEAQKRNMLMLGGKVMMDREAPEALRDTPQSSYDDTNALIEKWHGKGRNHYAITPRFAITSSPEQLEMAGALAKKHPDLHVQTHLSENKAEIEFTNSLYPEMGDYFGIYQHYGLAGEKSLFGHCIHLEDRERDAMIETGSVAVFCPTSNLFIGSGLFNWDRVAGPQGKGRIAIATDVGGGTNYSMLRTLDEGYKILNLQGQRMNPLTSFYQITLGNARALSLQEKIGTLDEGTDADIVVLNANATPAMQVRMETVTTLEEELFLLQTIGDDRAIVQTYVAGEALKAGLN